MSDYDQVKRDVIARAIVDSEAFMWLMAGANHPEAHLDALRPEYDKIRKLGGGWGSYSE